jgi:DNA-directed RNA polymerase specialized sigma24 family protein
MEADDAGQIVQLGLHEVVSSLRPADLAFPLLAVKRDLQNKLAPRLKAEAAARHRARRTEEYEERHAGISAGAEMVIEIAEAQDEAREIVTAKYDGALAAGRIDEPTHRILTLHHVEGLSIRDTAAQVGRPYEAVKKQLLRGRARVEGKVRQRPHGPKPRA